MSRNKYKENNIQLPVFLDLLTLLFVALKLIGVIDWSWWWVISPIWISLALLFVVSFLVYLCVSIKNRGRKSKKQNDGKAG